MLSAIFLLTIFTSTTYLPYVSADGTGLLGAGTWLYRPTCAHSCRRQIIYSPLVCEGDSSGSHASGSHSHSTSPSTQCFLKNMPFLQTMALCLDEHCGVDHASLADLQRYWEEGHLAKGTLSDSSLPQPVVNYVQALEGAQREAANRTIVALKKGAELNKTMRISQKDFQAMYNYQLSFEWGEIDHGKNSIAITVTTVALPILFSLSALLPYRLIHRVTAIVDQPLYGHKHRVPLFGAGTMPTRGQSLFFAYIVIINLVLMCLPLRTLQPNARIPGEARQALQIIGDRAGVLAAANLVPLLLTSARNNVLLWLTNWSHSTYLLLHRWLGYIVIIQTVVHSVGLLHYFLKYSNHAAESILPYWYWGIISTLAICLIWPLSILPIRQKLYDFFLVTHMVLSILALVGYFLHIWYLYKYNWGYEIWVYIAGAIWFVDRLLRVFRIARNGVRTASVTLLGMESDLLKVEIEGIVAEGHVYLYFPTLTWRFYENHPFSVLASFGSPHQAAASLNEELSQLATVEKSPAMVNTDTSSSPESSIRANSLQSRTAPKVTLLMRPENGQTRTLLEKTRSAGMHLKLPVLVESSYHSQKFGALQHCSTLLAIAGGVGITAILPLAQSFPGPVARLYWGVKHDDIVKGLAPELQQLRRTVSVEVKVGGRFDVQAIVQEEVLAREMGGDIGIVVCGPAEMADEVRMAVGRLAGSSKWGIVFIDEAFSWPRDGKNISIVDLNSIQIVALNLNSSDANAITMAMLTNRGLITNTPADVRIHIALADLNLNNVKVHDASLTRFDVKIGDSIDVNPEQVQ
ncbi:hypothetical protein EJ08DRAFT_701698 [Tothia fuscella]|uniref:Ferric oxidoreductase domain-containing protein n=1 Tax=Tothia fuscella TaxID=1048955 RepID=A0A9P4TUM4_9PEZI|nr:hypothetical protein EJ08DRAFT_701698 [Tothia fuscella]